MAANRSLLKAFLALTLIAKSASAAGGDGLAQENTRQLCTLSEELTLAPSLVATVVDHKRAAAEEARRDFLRTQIYISKNAQTGNLETLSLLGAQIDQSNKHTDLTSNDIAKATDAAATAARLNGALTEFLTIAANAYKADGNKDGCLTGDSATDVIAGPAQLGSCGLDHKQTTTNVTTELKQTTKKGFEKLQQTEGSTKVGHSTANCNLFGGQGGNANVKAQPATNQKFAAGYFLVAAGGVAKTFADLRDLTDQYSRPTLDEIKASTKARRLYHQYIKQNDNDFDNSKNGEAIAALLEATYGPAPNYETKTWDKILQEKIPNAARGKSGDELTQLAQISDLGELNEILGFYTGQYIVALSQRLKDAQKEILKLREAEAAESKSAEQICNSKKDAKACETDKNCKYDERKKKKKRRTKVHIE
ncbi:Trypanosome variant surface glycoprotein (A-type), putative [Trypanosoma equiperdum]|uniref:Trypanosome variant surface glycoprotein (A-type), putative n=1 Tax=Trypanosoma equiperdum TaxID=5694 RepID=A0A1G4I302_TRYEQ|nr:Trypanosome variant surface glycoprotein (A-type), putative [Trypanosoma equiperdum]